MFAALVLVMTGTAFFAPAALTARATQKQQLKSQLPGSCEEENDCDEQEMLTTEARHLMWDRTGVTDLGCRKIKPHQVKFATFFPDDFAVRILRPSGQGSSAIVGADSYVLQLTHLETVWPHAPPVLA